MSGACDSVLSLLMREEIWYLRAQAHFNMHYWRLVGLRFRIIDTSVKIISSLFALFGLVTIFSNEDYSMVTTVSSFVIGVFGFVILPALGWSRTIEKLTEIKDRWIDARTKLDSMWFSIEAGKTVTKKNINSVRGEMAKIGKINLWFGTIEKHNLKAQKLRDISIKC